MENQHRLIKGYRELNEEEIAAMNKIKNMGDVVIKAVVEEVRNLPGVDLRWVSIAQTDFQTGLMALTRAIAKPESF